MLKSPTGASHAHAWVVKWCWFQLAKLVKMREGKLNVNLVKEAPGFSNSSIAFLTS